MLPGRDPQSAASTAGGGGTGVGSVTDLHARGAIGGDLDSLAWIVSRISPLLEVRARDQLAGGLSAVCEPTDIVNTVWERALPKLRSLQAADRSHRHALLGFLYKIQTDLCIDLMRQLLRRKHFWSAARNAAVPAAASDPLLRLPADQTSIFSRVARDEDYVTVVRTLSDLSREDRELIFLRTLRGASNKEAAEALNLGPDLAAQRYHRAIAMVRRRLPPSVYSAIAP